MLECVKFFALRVIHIISAIITQLITQINRLCIHPNARIVFLQIFPVKGSRILFLFKRFQNVGITRNTSAYSEWPFPCWRPFAEFWTLCPYRQNQLPNQFSLIKVLNFHLFVVPSANPSFICFNIYKGLQPMPSQILHFIFHQSWIFIGC